MGLDWPHAHLLINHFPIILAVMGAVAVIAALITRYHGIWQYGVASLFFMGLSAYPAVFTGHRADHALNDPWYIVRGSIDRHQDAAELAMWVMLATGLVAAFAWWRSLPRNNERRALPPNWLRVLVLLGALGSLGTVTWASLLGGDIVYGSAILKGPRPAGVPLQKAPPGDKP